MRSRKFVILATMLVVICGLVLGCSFAEQVQEAEEVVQEAQENASGTIPTVIGTTVAAATGIPVAAPVISFLVGLGIAIFERKKRKVTEVVAGTLVKAIEGSESKKAIAEKVMASTMIDGTSKVVAKIVRDNT